MEILEFPTTQLFREINVEDYRSSKIVIFALSEALNLVFGKFQPLKMAKMIKI